MELPQNKTVKVKSYRLKLKNKNLLLYLCSFLDIGLKAGVFML